MVGAALCRYIGYASIPTLASASMWGLDVPLMTRLGDMGLQMPREARSVLFAPCRISATAIHTLAGSPMHVGATAFSNAASKSVAWSGGGSLKFRYNRPRRALDAARERLGHLRIIA